MNDLVQQVVGQSLWQGYTLPDVEYSRCKRIDVVLDFMVNNFREQITLEQVANQACMSVSAFCNWFKQQTGKTFVEMLNDLRISYACKLLKETDWQASMVAFSSGYQTLANFHKQFFRVKKLTPLQYRKWVLRGNQAPQRFSEHFRFR